ncbi:MAG TPA: 1-acyl-sn-glycerol-3-phosphate acyltransferase [Synechococcales cyanobacterium M55_K2018_004]|nr:1-acyl-sn-glycerol-3-phosphate acyltransferase [Synechococcales cyanobacterium M55_K2018_004]
MSNSPNQVQPPLKFIPPDFNPLIWSVVKFLLPLWMRWNSKIGKVTVENLELLVELYQQFQVGKVRFILAFRHPSTEDPVTMFYLLTHAVPRAARQMAVPLKAPVHAHFIYDRGIPLWVGDIVSWLYAKTGCTSIRRGGVDRPGLRSIRELFASGQFPMAAAPEGATNGHNDIVAPIEPGIAQFSFWCAEDLHKASRSEAVLVVPIGIRYTYVKAPWRSLERVLYGLEVDCGIAQDIPPLPLQDGVTPTSRAQAVLYQRLYRLGNHLLTTMEEFYRKFYHQNLPVVPDLPQPTNAFESDAFPLELNKQMGDRLQRLLNAALSVAEEFLAVAPKGSVTDRCRRIEQAAWDWIYREDLEPRELLSPVDRGLADRIATAANLRIWHMRIVETFVSVTGSYVVEKPTIERYAEMVLLLWDLVMRIKGEPAFPRVKLGLQTAKVTVGSPLSVSDRWPQYQENRRQAVATLTSDLQTAMEIMIKDTSSGTSSKS